MIDLLATHNLKTLNYQAIEKLLPHAGKMSLLNKVICADEKKLTATAISHKEHDNPLRINGTLSTLNGIEYAAQAMALHGALSAVYSGSKNTPQSGYIVAVRNIEIKLPFFPENAGELIIDVEKLMSNDNGFTYQFQINAQLKQEQNELISGKITVFLTSEHSEKQ